MFSDELLKQIQDRTTPEQQRNMENATPSWVTDTPAIVTTAKNVTDILISLIDDKFLVDTNSNCQCDLTEYLDTPCNICIALEIENTCSWCLSTWNSKENKGE
jgi:hypothetical protein